MGLFNKLFGEKVEVNYTDQNGTNRTKKVSKSDLDQWKSEGKMTELKTVKVNIAGINGVRIEKWTEEVNVPKETIDKFLDNSTGELYVGEYFEKGEKKQVVMKRDQWEGFKNL